MLDENEAHEGTKAQAPSQGCTEYPHWQRYHVQALCSERATCRCRSSHRARRVESLQGSREES